jgi:ubiquinone/menaquinone biosynthesis C-methylase UbiE
LKKDCRNSPLNRFRDTLVAAAKIIKDQGIASLAAQSIEKIQKMEFTVIGPSQDSQPYLIQRSKYEETWDRLSDTLDNAKMSVVGYTDEDELHRQGGRNADFVEKCVWIRPSDVVLEIGCGIGRIGKILAPHCSKWVGTDISANMIRHAAQRLKDLNNVELIKLSKVGLKEIRNESVDVVYCTVVFMHLYEWDQYTYVKEAYRVLSPGGRCYFDNLDITSKMGWKVFTDGLLFDIDKRPAQLSMISTGEELETYAMKAGFSDIKIHRWDDARVAVTGVKLPLASSSGVRSEKFQK